MIQISYKLIEKQVFDNAAHNFAEFAEAYQCQINGIVERNAKLSQIGGFVEFQLAPGLPKIPMNADYYACAELFVLEGLKVGFEGLVRLEAGEIRGIEFYSFLDEDTFQTIWDVET